MIKEKLNRYIVVLSILIMCFVSDVFAAKM